MNPIMVARLEHKFPTYGGMCVERHGPAQPVSSTVLPLELGTLSCDERYALVGVMLVERTAFIRNSTTLATLVSDE